MPAQTDFVLDGSPHGDVANQLADSGYNTGLYRPYLNRQGVKCVTLNMGKHYNSKTGKDEDVYEEMTLNRAKFLGFDAPTLSVSNATILRKDEWIMFDRVVVKHARSRLRVWSDLAAANTFSLDGMSSEILEHETINDPGEARVDMDGMSEGRVDAPLYQLEGLPLPITSSNFWFSQRKLSISRKLGRPLNTEMAGIAGRRVAETVEKTTLGTLTGITYGTTANYGRAPTVYGYTSHPARNTASITTPTGSNSGTTVSEILAMRTTLYNDGFFGPFMVYNGTDWDRYLDDDHFRFVTEGGAAPITTLRNRLRTIDDIQDVKRADFLSPANTGGTFDLIMVGMNNPEVARAVIGMPIRTLQWPSQGGLRLNFKVMTIMVPQIRADFSGNSGINHASVT
jgi:hypothetical protein